ncbi:MAG: hypothetical protein HDR35_09755 [Treponema sp.]|nr:hypothetical protein [Treponema sp.]
MSEVQNVAIHSQTALSGIQRSVREGDFLFVRILQNQGGGKYLASFAGGRFFVKSDFPLKTGETFRAQVKIVNGKFFLLPKNGSGKISGANAISVQNFNFQSPEASAFLASLGLPADGISQKILQFLMQSGARLDPALMKKARRLAAKFAGREIDAAESAILLEQKGFDSDDFLEEIMELLGGYFQEGENENPRKENSSDENSGENSAEKKSDSDSKNDAILENAALHKISDLENNCEFFLKQCADEIKNFFSSALVGDFQGDAKHDFALRNSDFGTNDFFSGENFKKNFLAFFNQKAAKNFSQGKKNWIFLPFEFEMNSLHKNGEDALRGAGVFRICVDLEKNLAEKISVNFKFAGKDLRFVLCFKDKKVCRVLFSFGDECGADFASPSAESLARIFGEGVEVRAISPEEFSAFGTEDFPLSSVEGFA